MGVSDIVPAVTRRAFVAVGAAALLCTASSSGLRAQQTTPQQPAAAQATPPDPFKFQPNDHLMVLVTIKGTEAADFETVMNMVKDALAKSTKPERKDQAAHWKFTKAGPISDGSYFFIWFLDPVSKDLSYNPFAILYEAGLPREQVDPLYQKFATTGVIAGITPLPYVPLADMGGAGGLH